MEQCVLGAKKLIDKQVNENRVSLFGISFSEFHKSYFWTNENISGYLELASFEGKNDALSVLASGDHAFNLVQKGVTNIDTFDTNRLTAHYALGFKRAMILKYSYEEFIRLMAFIGSDMIMLEEITEIIKGLLPYMEADSRGFWQEVTDYNYKVQRTAGTSLNLMQMLCINVGGISIHINCNDYLASKENYEALRSRLASANITFKCANAKNLAREFKGKYDFVLLSNILDYFDRVWGKDWDYVRLNEFVKKLETITNPGGIIFLEYLFDYPHDEKNPILFADSSTTSRDLCGEEVVRIPDEYLNMDAGMVLKRVK